MDESKEKVKARGRTAEKYSLVIVSILLSAIDFSRGAARVQEGNTPAEMQREPVPESTAPGKHTPAEKHLEPAHASSSPL